MLWGLLWHCVLLHGINGKVKWVLYKQGITMEGGTTGIESYSCPFHPGVKLMDSIILAVIVIGVILMIALWGLIKQ